MPSEPEKLLIVGPAWVGDMVMAQSLFITLKQQNPESLIDVVAPGWSEPILRRMPEVRRPLSLATGHGQFGLMARYRLGRELRAEHYDRAIVTPRSFKSALVPYFARARQRTGYKGEMRYGLLNDIRPLDKSVLTQTVQRYVALGLPSTAALPPVTPFPALHIDTENQQQQLQVLGLALDRPVVAFFPGAEYGPAKCWPIERYAQLAKQLVAEGCQVWVMGSQKDQAAADQIAAIEPGIVDLCGSTRLEDAIDLIACASAVVTNDSGLMHVAAAVGRPMVAIYGSSTPDYTPPLTDKATVLYKDLDCSPCFKRECPYGHTQCLNDINVDEVFSAVKPLLG